MREATKSQLADAIGQICPRFERADTEPTFTVFDGGSLLHRIQWKKETLFDTICKRYVELVKQSVGPVVVFDGYGNGPSTKDSTHQRRARGIVGSKISGFSGNKLLTTTKERFLSNETNKNNFIILLKQHLESEGVRTTQASGDADCLISQTGVDLSTLGPTFVIGEDTDLLIILCHRQIACSHRRGVCSCEPQRKTRNINYGTLDIYVRLLAKSQVQRHRSSTQLLVVIRRLVCSA
ncbi:Uncharacterised protein r2_g127 [Pycnogonum litorale]